MYSAGCLRKVNIMYIYDRTFLGGQSEVFEPHLLGEFRLNRLPAKVQQRFSKVGASWQEAVAEAIGSGIKNPNVLADIIFFMQHQGRMAAGIGKLIDRKESDFVK